MFESFMTFLDLSYQVVVSSLSKIFGNFVAKNQALIYSCLPHGTPKQMIKLNNSIESLNNISELTLTISKTTGLISYS